MIEILHHPIYTTYRSYCQNSTVLVYEVMQGFYHQQYVGLKEMHGALLHDEGKPLTLST